MFCKLTPIMFWSRVSCHMPSKDGARGFMQKKRCSDPSRNTVAINRLAFRWNDSGEVDRICEAWTMRSIIEVSVDIGL